MKVTVEQAALLKSLARVHRVVERRTTIPILSNVLLRASGGALSLRATDLDLEVSEALPAEVAREGATTVPAHVLHDIVRKLSDGAQVSLELNPEGTQVVLRSGRSRFQLQALPETDFPDLASGESTHRFRVPAKDLARLVSRVGFAISTEETRYYLNGIFLHAVDGPNGGHLRAVATDGHRLARADVAAPEGAAGMPGIIVPRKAVTEVTRLVADEAGQVDVELSAAKIRFAFGAGEDGGRSGVVLTTKLIDGTFPDYGRVIPTGNDKVLEVDREAFARAVDRVSTISSERGRAVKLSLTEGQLSLTVNNPDAGNAVEEIEVSYDSAPLDIGFNARYLLDIAGQIEGDTAELRLNDPGSPTLIQDKGAAGGALYVLMPMRV